MAAQGAWERWPTPLSPLPTLVFPGPPWWLKSPESPIRPLGLDLLLSLTPHLPKPEGEGQFLSVLSAPTAQGQLLILQHTPPWMLPEAQLPVCPFISLFPIGPPRVHQPLLLSPWRLGQKGTTYMRALSLSGCDSSSLKPEGARAFPLPWGLALVGVRQATFLTWSSRVQGSLLGDSELGSAEGCGAWRFLTVLKHGPP